MSSPIIPGVNITVVTQTPDATSAPEAPADASVSAPTIGQGFLSQQDSVNQAASNVPSVPVPTGDQRDADLPTLTPEQLTALQLQSAAQRQSGADASAVQPGAPVSDVAPGQPQLLPLFGPLDLLSEPATIPEDYAAANDPIDPATTDALDALEQSFKLAFSHLLEPTMVMDLGFFLAGNWLFNNISLGFTGNRPGGRMFQDDVDDSNRTDNNVETVSTQRWIETMQMSGKLKEVMIEEVKEKLKDFVISDQRRVLHVFEPSEVAQTLKQHDLAPSDMLHNNAACQTLAQAAQRALQELSQVLPTRRIN